MVECPDLDDDLIKLILKEYKISNVDMVIRSECTEDDIIDIVEVNF